jgi:hypothetical protein
MRLNAGQISALCRRAFGEHTQVSYSYGETGTAPEQFRSPSRFPAAMLK